jgi:hypothetical protein
LKKADGSYFFQMYVFPGFKQDLTGLPEVVTGLYINNTFFN